MEKNDMKIKYVLFDLDGTLTDLSLIHIYFDI